MQDNYTVRYLPIAEDDLLDIYDRIANEYPDKAAEFTDKLDKKIKNLASNPLLGRVTRDDKLSQYGYRFLVIGSYLVFYVIRDKTIEIHRIIHGSRNLNNIL